MSQKKKSVLSHLVFIIYPRYQSDSPWINLISYFKWIMWLRDTGKSIYLSWPVHKNFVYFNFNVGFLFVFTSRICIFIYLVNIFFNYLCFIGFDEINNFKYLKIMVNLIFKHVSHNQSKFLIIYFFYWNFSVVRLNIFKWLNQHQNYYIKLT